MCLRTQGFFGLTATDDTSAFLNVIYCPSTVRETHFSCFRAWRCKSRSTRDIKELSQARHITTRTMTQELRPLSLKTPSQHSEGTDILFANTAVTGPTWAAKVNAI